MIRAKNDKDINRIMEIWINTNIKTHSFIDESYWRKNFSIAKDMISESEIYVYEINGEIVGFIGLMDYYIAGIFVDCRYQSKGIGKELIDYIKNIKKQLNLNVYIKNSRAVDFYLREGFTKLEESIDDNTNECEYKMIWKNNKR
ncbi:GNAT family N-acetyltransferase [Peptacetobacter hominis]|uniref:GNAT family N-acetyltransferase n=1 Tax=Peptacetobacter hominis TaxID=2743610 RepID=A0A544QX54_9FIRM|nr:GNAT family N-acetyltransferase [Peptacetobacter hominis]TQQ85274.1 GNAT family N-acetyltransferase [Peptacetobacter hominis]